MTKHEVALVVPILAMALVAPPTQAQQAGPPQPPAAARRPHTTEIHGYTLKDDYFWLREKANPEVIKYLESENAYTEEVMQPTKALQETLYSEMLGRIKQTDLSVPSRIGDYFYYSRTEEGKQYPYMCRRKGSMEGAEEILLDLNALAEGHKFLGLGAYVVSDDGNWLAYSTDTTGYRQYTLHVKDLRKGQALAENIERVGSVVWATDNKTLFYTTEDAGLEAIRQVLAARRRRAGQRSGLRGEGRALRRRRRPIARQEDDLPRELREDVDRGALPAGGRPGCQSQGRSCRARPGHEYDVDHYSGALLHHDQQGREELQGRHGADRRSVGEELEAVHRSQSWRCRSSGLTFFANHIVVSEREGGLTQLRVIDMKTEPVASHRDRRARLRDFARRATPSSTRRRCASTTSRWSRRRRSTTTT